jgi:hypothetical protein
MASEVEMITSIPQPPYITLLGGQTKVIKWRLPPAGAYELIIEQNVPRPDFTLRAWISSVPVDKLIMNTWNQRHFSLPKIQSRVWLGSKTHKPNPELEKFYLSIYEVEPDTTYYLNVKNLENFHNGFELAFIIPGTSIIIPAPDEIIIKEPEIPIVNETTINVEE